MSKLELKWQNLKRGDVIVKDERFYTEVVGFLEGGFIGRESTRQRRC